MDSALVAKLKQVAEELEAREKEDRDAIAALLKARSKSALQEKSVARGREAVENELIRLSLLAPWGTLGACSRSR